MKIFKYLRKDILIFYSIGMLINSLTILIKPLLIEKVLVLQDEQLSMNTATNFLIFGLLLHIFFYTAMLFANYMSNILQKHLQILLKKKLISVLYLKSIKVDERISLLTQDMEHLYSRYFLAIDVIIGRCIIVFTSVFYILYQNAKLGVLFVIFSMLRLLPQFIRGNKLKESGDDFSNHQRTFHMVITDFFRGEKTIYYNDASKEYFDRTTKTIEELETKRFNNEWVGNLTYFFNGPVEFVSQVIPLFIGLFFKERGLNITTASLISMYVASSSLNAPLQTLIYRISDIQRVKVLKDKIFTLLDTYEEREFELPYKKVNELVVEGITKEHNQRIFYKNISFSLKNPCKMLIKGVSGSGKTSLLNMLVSEKSMQSGKVWVKDENGKISTDFLGSVSYISQNPYFFNDTIRQNITLGLKISDDILLRELKKVGLVEEIPHILDYFLVNNASNISGGQRLRLELVRALVRNKDIILADEVTASLDKNNRRKIEKVLHNLQVILIEVSHNVSNELIYDKIIELK